MQRDEPHHQSKGPRERADLYRQGGRERPIHGREPSVRAVRIRAQPGRERRLAEPPRAEGRLPEECLERAAYAIDDDWSLTGEGTSCTGDVGRMRHAPQKWKMEGGGREDEIIDMIDTHTPL